MFPCPQFPIPSLLTPISLLITSKLRASPPSALRMGKLRHNAAHHHIPHHQKGPRALPSSTGRMRLIPINPIQAGKALFIQLPNGKSSWGEASPSQTGWSGGAGNPEALARSCSSEDSSPRWIVSLHSTCVTSCRVSFPAQGGSAPPNSLSQAPAHPFGGRAVPLRWVQGFGMLTPVTSASDSSRGRD